MEEENNYYSYSFIFNYIDKNRIGERKVFEDAISTSYFALCSLISRDINTSLIGTLPLIIAILEGCHELNKSVNVINDVLSRKLTEPIKLQKIIK